MTTFVYDNIRVEFGQASRTWSVGSGTEYWQLRLVYRYYVGYGRRKTLEADGWQIGYRSTPVRYMHPRCNKLNSWAGRLGRVYLVLCDYIIVSST